MALRDLTVKDVRRIIVAAMSMPDAPKGGLNGIFSALRASQVEPDDEASPYHGFSNPPSPHLETLGQLRELGARFRQELVERHGEPYVNDLLERVMR